MAPTSSKPRGRRKTADRVTVEQIAAGALELLIHDGVESFSVRNLAKQLGVGTATIYWHMETRNDVLVAAMAYAWREFIPPPPTDDWKAWFRDLFFRFREMIQKNRGVARILGSRLVGNAGVDRRLIESILSTLTQAGFDERNIAGAFNAVWVAMVGFVTMEFGPEPDDSPEWEGKMRERINTVNVAEYPWTAQYLPLLSNKAFSLRWENGSTAPMDASFKAYVDVVLLGLESMAQKASLNHLAGQAA